jgi:chromatin assembly factor 1 subunit B
LVSFLFYSHLKTKLIQVLCRSPDGQCLILSSRDGYCTIVVFDEIIAAHHVQQQTLQFQSIAHNHAVPLTSSSSVLTPSTTPALSTISLPPSVSPRMQAKRSLTPAKSVVLESDVLPVSDSSAASTGEATATLPVDNNDEPDKAPEPPKKKRRVALTRIGDVGS